MAIPAGPSGPFVLSSSKDRLRVFGIIEIANPRIEYAVTMTKSVRVSGLTGRPQRPGLIANRRRASASTTPTRHAIRDSSRSDAVAGLSRPTC